MVKSEHDELSRTGGSVGMGNNVALAVYSLNLSEKGGVALLTNDEIVAVTNYYDDDGNNMTRQDAFTWFVCGPSTAGYWFTERMEDFTFKKRLDS